MRYLLLAVALSAAQEPAREREDAIRLATDALAEKLGISRDSIRLQSASNVTWRDAGLGCREDGLRYDPLRTPGYRVLLRFDSRLYRVHVGSDRALVCGKPIEVGSAPVPETPPSPREKADALEPIVEAARKDLSQRLAVEVERIEVVEARAVVWPDGSLGCPEPGMMYTQALQDGARVRLRYGSKLYAYHSGGSRGPFLCEAKPDQREPKALR